MTSRGLPLSTVDIVLLTLAVLGFGIYRLLRVPPHLRHIPKVPLLPLLFSYFSGEVEEQRVKRLVLPFAKRMQTDVVLVYCLGDWMVQVLESKLGKQLLENPNVWKQRQSQDMLLWRLIGNDNVFMSNGEMAKRHLRIVRNAIQQTMPVDMFADLARTTISLIGDGGRVRWDDYANRYTLDAFGRGVVGYDFQALTKPSGSFVRRYQEVMAAIANPAYVVLPVLERWLPRRQVQKMIDSFVEDLCKIMDEKRKNPGNDVLTYMFQEPDMTEVEYRDNCIVMFVAGHDTTAGAISSVVYFLARHPEIQDKVREEILAVLGDDDPRVEHFLRTPYLNAVLRESMRHNTPSNATLPRICDIPVEIGPYVIPPNTPMILNMCAAHHNQSIWTEPDTFDPQRFFDDARGEANNWVTFGIGPRKCLARNFSQYEQRVLVSMLLREYHWALPKDSAHRDHLKNGFQAFALSLPENLHIDFTRITAP
ncbi:cytochrome P450 [Lentinus tigrinus ALCF2SS1-7]|uniref:Cytochrome P450 n=1 Tax=Lentinus tigrinus ALCF2SS1-6 TaxID=1328759 RepID=A0A5C2SY40_9APHY|nr:cytochrome P450 [Lentinus tigrinus ALCF2SS1-6]RPD79714.1 cytochrome P450 [Lentinus tigrinus ALCF2SS1-7]